MTKYDVNVYILLYLTLTPRVFEDIDTSQVIRDLANHTAY